MELRREADELLGTSDVAGDIETANKLAWAGAVANETMRLRPVAPILILEAKVETVVGDLLVPEGTRVFVLTRPAACDPDHFVEPQAFRPRRWLGETRRRARRIGAHSVWFGSSHLSRPRSRPARDEAVALDALQEFQRRTGGRSGRRPGKLRIYDVASGPESAPAPPLQRPGRHGNRLNRPAAPGRFLLSGHLGSLGFMLQSYRVRPYPKAGACAADPIKQFQRSTSRR